MSFKWLSRLDCAPMKQKEFQKRLLFIASNFNSLYDMRDQKQRPALSREELYMAMDPDLAALKKQVKDAEAHFARLKRLYGRGDPMLDMAMWQLASCQSGFDTRMLEVQADKKLTKRVNDILAGEDELDYRQAPEDSQMQIVHKRSRRKKDISTGALLFWVLLTLFNPGNFGRRFRPSYTPA